MAQTRKAERAQIIVDPFRAGHTNVADDIVPSSTASSTGSAMTRPTLVGLSGIAGLFRFRTRRRCCDLLFGRMSRLGQDSGLCLFACAT